MPKAFTDNGIIEYQITGSGKPMAMLLPQSTGPFGIANFIKAISKNFSVLTYDQNNSDYRNSIKRLGTRSIEQYADEIARLLEAIGCKETLLCCHSTGCGIGLALTACFPERIQGLALINPWFGSDEYLVSIQNLRIKMAEMLDPKTYSEFNSSLLFPPYYRRMYHKEFEQLAKNAIRHPHDPNRIENRLNAIVKYDARPISDRIRCPTLVISAQDDQLMPKWFSEDLAGKIKRAKLLIIKDGGHMLLETRGDIIARELQKFSMSI